MVKISHLAFATFIFLMHKLCLIQIRFVKLQSNDPDTVEEEKIEEETETRVTRTTYNV